ncbi:MAG: metallophosphoesterase family protein [Candidatus Woesebacteria bacterium]
MKTLIFSDTHLTTHFDSVKFDFLKDLFRHYDRIIMNGDFWDGYEVTFARFAKSDWRGLFPYMREKTIYIYGNHDRPEWTTHPELFSRAQYDRYTIQVGKKELVIEHGHKIAPSFDISYPKISYILSLFFSSRRFQFGNKLRGWENMQMKKYAQSHLTSNQILVCGHSHIAENSRKQGYINTGMIDYGIATYLSVDGEKMTLVTQTYG